MKYTINAISPTTGCVMPIHEDHGEIIGVAPIEAGDYDRAKALLSDSDYQLVCTVWTSELLTRREIELKRLNQA